MVNRRIVEETLKENSLKLAEDIDSSEVAEYINGHRGYLVEDWIEDTLRDYPDFLERL